MDTSKVVIVDDEHFAREAIKVYLTRHPEFTVVGEASSGSEAMEVIQETKPDLVFLDIQIPGLNGFEVLQRLNLNTLPVVIFATAFNQFALRAFDVNAVDYLLKPFDQERFDISLEKAKIHLDSKTGILPEVVEMVRKTYEGLASGEKEERYLDKILIKESKRFFFIDVQDVFWLEASGDYVTVHTEHKKHLINETLSNISEKLNPDQFVRVHRSSVVNTKHILHFEPHFNGEFFIKMKNNDVLKLSRTHRDKLKVLFGEPF